MHTYHYTHMSCMLAADTQGLATVDFQSQEIQDCDVSIQKLSALE